MFYIKLAWRNIWRNKKRSLITIGSIFFAVLFAIILRSMQLGMYDKMIDSVVRSWFGYIQIHEKGYWEEQSLENTFERNITLEEELTKQNEIENVIPRVEGFALLSYSEKVRGIHLAGIEPEKENRLSKIKEKIISGEYITDKGNEILISEGLASQLNIALGDTIALISQGYNAVSASGLFKVKGVVKLVSTQMNNSSVYIPLQTAQEFYGTGNRLTALVVQLHEGAESFKVIDAIRNMLSKNFEIMSWQEMLPELVQMIQADSSGGEIMVFILYMVITFGIFGTILMMVTERNYEFGVLISIGMSKLRLSFIVIFESIMISLIGVASGIIISRPLIYYFNINPITLTGKAADTLRKFGFEPLMPTLTDLNIPFTHGSIVLTISLILSTYSIFSIYKLDPLKAAKR